MAIETTLGNGILNWLKGTAMPTAPATVYLSVWDGDPNASGVDKTSTIDATGRKAVTFGAVAAKQMANSAEVDFGTADANANVSWYALHDASSGGNRLISFPLQTARSISAGDPVKFAIGDLIVGY